MTLFGLHLFIESIGANLHISNILVTGSLIALVIFLRLFTFAVAKYEDLGHICLTTDEVYSKFVYDTKFSIYGIIKTCYPFNFEILRFFNYITKISLRYEILECWLRTRKLIEGRINFLPDDFLFKFNSYFSIWTETSRRTRRYAQYFFANWGYYVFIWKSHEQFEYIRLEAIRNHYQQSIY